MESEDLVKLSVRDQLRNLQLSREQYQIAVASAALAYERVVSTRLELQLGRDVTARDFLEAQQAYTASLNAVAVEHIGYITDRIAETLRGFGLTDVLIDIGEIRALGASPDSTPWRVGIAGPGGGCCADRITLTDRALATSATFGTVMDDTGEQGHILDPTTGFTASHARQVSISAPRADIADGLSTALCAAAPSVIDAALAAFPQARLEDLAL